MFYGFFYLRLFLKGWYLVSLAKDDIVDKAKVEDNLLIGVN